MRLRRLGLILGVVLLCTGLCWDFYLFWRVGPQDRLLLTANLLPGLILLGAYWCTARLVPAGGRGPSVWTVTLAWIAAFVLAGVALLCAAAAHVIPPLDVTRAGMYPSVVTSLKQQRPGWIAHFAADVPADARKVRFYYRPAFMQGGATLQLRYETTPAAARALLSRYLPDAKQVRNGSPDFFHAVNSREDGLPTASFRDERNRTSAPLPSDFRVLVLDARGSGGGVGGWNHGHSRGVAVSVRRNEVIYWAEYW